VKRIECDLGGGRLSVGTGYICGIAHSSGMMVPILITNKHVLEGANKIRVCIHTGLNGSDEAPDGGIAFVEIPAILATTVLHDDPTVDLCGILLGPLINFWKQVNPGRSVYYKVIMDDLIYGPVETLDVCEQVTMVGCPNAIWDAHNGFPLFRRGFTASPPASNFQGRREFAVDIAVFSGSSGSPIFLMDSGPYTTADKPADIQFGRRFGLLGTLWGGPRITEEGTVEIKPAPTSAGAEVAVDVRMHLGYVIKASETAHLLKKAASEFGDIDLTAQKMVETLKPPTAEAIRETFKRNALCFCGSKMKYKHCHGKILSVENRPAS